MRDYFELQGARAQMRDRTTGAGRPIARLSILASPKSKHDMYTMHVMEWDRLTSP